MSTLETVLLSLLVIDALALISLVLIQQGKGADVGAAFEAVPQTRYLVVQAERPQ